MRTCLLSAVKKVEIKEFDIPEVGEGSVLIKVEAAGVCGSDFHAFLGSHPFRKPPMVFGHEAAGQIVKIGVGVKDLHVGDRVTVEPVKTCGKCSFCQNGQYNICPEKIMAGVKGWLGTFAEYFVIEAKRVYKLPPHMDYDIGVLAEPLAVGTHAVRIGGLKKDMVCAVLGTGTIGLFTGIAAQSAGAKKVFCTDINSFRLNMAKEAGLTPIKADEVSAEAVIREEFPDGPDVVFLALSSVAVLDQAVHMVKRGGTIVIIGVFNDPAPVNLNVVQLSEISIRGTSIYTKEDYQRALMLLEEKTAIFQKAVTHHIKFEGVSEAFQMLADPNNHAIKVVVKP